MGLKLFGKTQMLAYMLISQALCLGHIVLHGLEALLHVRLIFPDKLPSEINIIKRFASWNDFLESVVNSIINKTLNTPSVTADSDDANETNNGVTIYFCVPYYGDKGCSLIKSCIRKIRSNCK